MTAHTLVAGRVAGSADAGCKPDVLYRSDSSGLALAFYVNSRRRGCGGVQFPKGSCCEFEHAGVSVDRLAACMLPGPGRVRHASHAELRDVRVLPHTAAQASSLAANEDISNKSKARTCAGLGLRPMAGPTGTCMRFRRH